MQTLLCAKSAIDPCIDIHDCDQAANVLRYLGTKKWNESIDAAKIAGSFKPRDGTNIRDVDGH